MLTLFGLGYLLSAGDGGMAGISRVQVKQDFVINIKRLIRAIEAAIAGALGTVLRMLDPEGEFNDQQLVVNLRLFLGVLLPEERIAILESYEKGFISKTTAMEMLGDSVDTDAELALMKQEKEEAFLEDLQRQEQLLAIQNTAQAQAQTTSAGIEVKKIAQVSQINLDTEAQRSQILAGNKVIQP